MDEIFTKIVYAGLLEIIKDKGCYYNSTVATRYCKFTPEGEREVLDFINLVAPVMLDKEQVKIDKLYKEHMWAELKK